MKVPLEDFFPDIIGKAQRGLHLDDASVAQRSRLERDQVERLKEGSGDRSQVAALGTALDLAPGALVESFEKSWEPAEIALEGLVQFNTDLLGMTVNVYLVWDPSSREAAIFDAGIDAMNPPAGFKASRRKFVEKTFRWLESLSESYYSE